MKWNGARTRHDREFWNNHIERWRTSGLSQGAYCAKHGLAVPTLAGWVGKLRRARKPETPLVEIPGRAERLADDGQHVIEIEIGLVRVRVREGIDGGRLAAMVAAVLEVAR